MGETAVNGGGDTARLLVVGAVAAGAACAATSLYWRYRALPLLASSTVGGQNPAKKEKGRARKKNHSHGKADQVGGDLGAMSTAATSPTMAAGAGPAMYEQRRAVNEYVQFHFGKPDDVLPYKDGPFRALEFTARCAELCAKHTKSCRIVRGNNAEGLALDVGCAVGGASFELARHFREVVGIDFSKAFVSAAKLMKERGKLPYTTVKEADITVRLEGAVSERIDRSRVTFRQADACKLPTSLLGGGGSLAHITEWGRHDAVLAANLLCRLPDPGAFLRACARLVRPGGVLVLVSPYSWLEAWTPRDKWLGGFYEELTSSSTAKGSTGGEAEASARLRVGAGIAGSSAVMSASLNGVNGGSRSGSPRPPGSVAVRSFDVILAALTSPEGGFDLVEQSDQPFLIKEHDRKYQWGCSHATVWRRRKETQEQ